MGFLKHGRFLKVACIVMIMMRSSMGGVNVCPNQNATAAPTPVTNDIQIFTTSSDEPDSNGTRDILSAIKELGVAVASLQSQQHDLAKATATVVAHQQMMIRDGMNKSIALDPLPASCSEMQLAQVEEAVITKLNDAIMPRLDNLSHTLASIVAGQPAQTAPGEKPTFPVVRTHPRDCHEILQSGLSESGVYIIQPDRVAAPFSAYCDMATDGGGWTVFQRREDGSVDFQRNWTEYRNGFGEISGDHWLGNENIHYLSIQKTHVLRVDLWAFDGDSDHAEYHEFSICEEKDNYRLKIGEYFGTAGDGLIFARDDPFSTFDVDNDGVTYQQSADKYHTGWWMHGSSVRANLNGIYRSDGNAPASYDGIIWYPWKGERESMKNVEMKVRPR